MARNKLPQYETKREKYQGYEITILAYTTDSGKWTAEIRIVPQSLPLAAKPQLYVIFLTKPQDTREKAVEQAVLEAMECIDELTRR